MVEDALQPRDLGQVGEVRVAVRPRFRLVGTFGATGLACEVYGWSANPLALNSPGFCLRKLRDPDAVVGQPRALAAEPRSSL